jgi:thymidylate kinase
VIIYFNVDTAVAKQRMIGRGQAMDVIELKGTDFQDKVRQSFLDYLEEYQNKALLKADARIFIVDANQSIDGVRSQLDKILEELHE